MHGFFSHVDCIASLNTIDISGKNIFFSWHKIGILYEHLIRNYSEVAVRNTKTISAKKDKIE